MRRAVRGGETAANAGRATPVALLFPMSLLTGKQGLVPAAVRQGRWVSGIVSTPGSLPQHRAAAAVPIAPRAREFAVVTRGTLQDRVGPALIARHRLTCEPFHAEWPAPWGQPSG